MILSLSEQTLVFLWACLFGVLLGCYYSIFRVVRMAFGDQRAVSVVCDLLFFLSAAVFVYLFFLRFCSGQIRVYVLVGEALGFFACYFSAGALFVRLSAALLRLLRRLFHVLSRPFLRLFCVLKEKRRKKGRGTGTKTKKSS